MWVLPVGALMGVSLGANDGGNLFGTAVATRVVRFRTAALLAAVFVVLGAALQGESAMQTVRTLTVGGQRSLGVIVLCAAFTIAVMTWLGLPVSTTQALVGAIMGVTLSIGQAVQVDIGELMAVVRKIVLCWLLTPIGAGAIAMVLYYVVGVILERLPIGMLTRDNIILSGLVLVGAYCAYALGANNTANVVGIYKGQFAEFISDRTLAVLGGASIAVGIMAFSRRLMHTIGAGLIRLDGFTALVVVLAEAVTLHFFGVIGIPVSASQAVVGGVLGVGLIRGAAAINTNVLKNILIGWFFTPLMALVLSAAGYALFVGRAS